jgi:glycosyltransferase involved in cell wall biosynthesis
MRLIPVPARSLTGLVRAQVSVAPTLPGAMVHAIREARPDVVWAHSLQFQTTHVACWAARRAGVPLVVTVHIGDLGAVPGALGLAARVHEATLGRWILRAATRAIAVSDPVADHLRRLDSHLAVDVVPNGLDLERFRAVSTEHGRFQVGFLGRLVVNKGPETAVRALGELTRRGVDATLAFVGDGPDRARLARLADHEGVGERVLFEGYRPDPERWFATIDVLVRPSLTEGMPLGLLEAMAAGVPVVASDIPGNRSLVRDGETGLLVPPRDPVRLAKALERLAASPTLRRQLRAAGIAATAEMTWERAASLTAASLAKAAGWSEAAFPCSV